MFDGFRDFQAEAGNYKLLVLVNICLKKSLSLFWLDCTLPGTTNFD